MHICLFMPQHPAGRKRRALQAAAMAFSFLAACGNAQAQERPQAVRLKEIKDLGRLDPEWIMGMCNLPGLECNKVQVPRLFERRSEGGAEYYALMEGLTLSRLVMKAPGRWELLNRWSFQAYPLSREGGAEKPTMLDIHPALYPAGPGRWAVAVLDRRAEAYSGGGAEFVRADFVALDEQVGEVEAGQRLFRAVPFSCSKIVRACFTEAEYKTSPHCHDESTGYLTLKFSLAAAGGSFGWAATWHQTHWPAGLPKTARTKTQATVPLKPGAQSVPPGAFAFCGGPDEG